VTNPNDIIAAAIGRSSKNRADVIATSGTELLRLINSTYRGAYAIAAEVNPVYFATSADVAYAAPGWARPSNAENVFRIEIVGGAEVAVVPYDDQIAEGGLPSVYPFGRIYVPTGSVNGPLITDSLRIFFSKLPTVLAAVGTSLEAAWPTQFDNLLIEDVATYLAIKDGRSEEAKVLSQERNRWLVMYVKFLEHETTNLRRRFGQRKQFNTQSIVATFAPYLLSGGSGDT
jgi:hypothetical protein